MANLVQLLPLGLFMLLTTSLVAIAVRRVRIPYPGALDCSSNSAGRSPSTTGSIERAEVAAPGDA